MSSWVRDIIFNICFFFHACLASGGVECLAIMTRYCYNTICTSSTPNHWEQVFHYPPAASYSCLFMPHNKGEMSTGCSKIPAQTALRSMDALIRHREWASSLGEKKKRRSSTGECWCNRESVHYRGAPIYHFWISMQNS